MSFTQKKILILSDFDGTICSRDIGNEILNKFTDKGWTSIDREYVNGILGSRAAYEKIAPLIKGDRKEMREFILAKGKLAPGFLKFYQLCSKKGVDVKIVSDGLDFYIRGILENKGFTDIEFFSNAVEFRGDESIAITFPRMNELCGRCGTCKNLILNSFRLMYEQIIYIGDGHSDWCPSRYADLVFAKGVLLKKYQQENLPCIAFDDFRAINKYLKNNL